MDANSPMPNNISKQKKLEIVGLRKSFGALAAVSDVSLSVEAGETVVLLGSSGCGKTTLLRMIAGFIQPDAGAIRVNGREVASSTTFVPPERRALSMVFQNYAVWPHKTVFENLAYGLKIKKLPRSEIEERVNSGLELVRMVQYRDRYPGELSGGQQQRVALARALVLEPEILLFDEPLSNLDAALREHMRFEIRSILDALRITSIYVTHDQDEAMVVGNRIAVMNAGTVEQIGTSREIYNNPQTRFVASFVGINNKLKGIVKSKVEGGLIVEVLGFGPVHVSTDQQVSAGAAVEVFVRPTDIGIGLHEVDHLQNVYQAIVEQSTFLGANVDYVVKVGDVPLRIVASARGRTIEKGRTATIQFHASHCQVLLA